MLTAAADTRALWYLTRGTGLVTLVLLTMSVVLGVVETVRWATPRWPRFVTAALHRNVSLLVMVLLAVHIVTSVLDGFVPIRWLDSVVPFVSAYRPVWLGLGALAFDLMLALVITSLARRYIGYPAWRAIHWTAYACWPLALVHGLGTGSDTRLNWVLVLNLACLAAVLAAVAWRLAVGWDGSGGRTAAALAGVTAPLVLVGWLVTGPLRDGWARRAGTPVTVLAGAATPAGSTPAPSGGGAPAGLQAPFSAQLSGTLTQSGPDGNGISTVTIDAGLTGGAAGQLRLVLQGPTTSDGGVRMTASSARLGPAGQPAEYQGRIASLNGTSMVVDLADSSGPDHAVGGGALHHRAHGVRLGAGDGGRRWVS